MPERRAILVRHAESEHHVLRLSGGWTDTPLTQLGHEQARLVAQRLRREVTGAVRVYSSDLKRAAETAAHIGTAFDVAVTTDWRLREGNNGEAIGLTVAEMLERFPQQPFPHDLDYRPFSGGETGREFAVHVASFVDELEYGDGVPIIVTHGGTMLPFISRWLGIPIETTSSWELSSSVTGITVLRTGWHGMGEIERFNDVAHLDGTESYVSIGRAVS